MNTSVSILENVPLNALIVNNHLPVNPRSINMSRFIRDSSADIADHSLFLRLNSENINDRVIEEFTLKLVPDGSNMDAICMLFPLTLCIDSNSFLLSIYGVIRCQKRFFTEELLQQHIATHKGFACTRCHNVFESENILKEHSTKCKGFVALKMTKMKIDGHQSLESVQSQNGSITFATAQPLQTLQDRIQREQQSPNRKMDKSLHGKPTQKVLSEDRIDNEVNERYHCVECDRYFKSGQSLGGHRARVHSVKRKQAKQKESDKINDFVNKQINEWREGLKSKGQVTGHGSGPQKSSKEGVSAISAMKEYVLSISTLFYLRKLVNLPTS